jgi:siroheme decarboxylase
VCGLNPNSRLGNTGIQQQVTRIMIDQTDKKIISVIQGDLPLHAKPFAVLAEKIGMTEKAFLKRIRDLKKEGIIRRFGATLRHQEAGFNSNAMIAWLAPDERIDEIGTLFSRSREVTHCYHRAPQKDWPYNLYTMVHGRNREACRRIAERLSQSAGVSDYLLLFSEKEFKKTSMAYFSEKGHDQ